MSEFWLAEDWNNIVGVYVILRFLKPLYGDISAFSKGKKL